MIKPYLMNIVNDKGAAAIIFIGLVIRGISSALIPPGFDEAYYGVYSQHLSAGYFDHPPLVAFIAGIGQWLTHSFSPLSLRAGSILVFLFTSFIVYKLTEELFDKKTARIALLLLYATPYFFMGTGAFVFPDAPLTFFWSAFLYSLLKFHSSLNGRWLLVTGILLGFALLSKYHAIFLLIGWGTYLVLDRNWRPFLKTPYPYLGILLSLLIFLPNIIWNAKHHWISYVFEFSKASHRLNPSATLLVQTLGIQMAYLMPWNFILLLGALWYVYRNSLKNTFFLFPFILLPVGVFTFIGTFRPILPHWPMPGYLAAIPLGAFWMSQWENVAKKLYLFLSGAVLFLILLVLILQAKTGIFNIDTKIDPTLDGSGWSELIQHIEKESLLQDNAHFIFSAKWFLSGELAWASQGKYTVTVLNRYAPHAFAFWAEPKNFVGKTGLFICTNRYYENPEKLYKNYFSAFQKLKDFNIYRNGKIVKTFYLWKCLNMTQKFKWPYGNH